MSKPTIPEVLDRFLAYRVAHSDWRSLRVFLGDGEFSEDAVVACSVRAIEAGDTEGYDLSQILLQMSKTQRKKLFHRVRSD